MTVVTKPISHDRKQDEKAKEALVNKEVNDQLADVAITICDKDRKHDHQKTVSLASTACLLVLVAVGLVIGASGVAHLYQIMHLHNLVRGNCRLPFLRLSEDTIITGDFRPCDDPPCNRPRFPESDMGMMDMHMGMDGMMDDSEEVVAEDGHIVKPLKKVFTPELEETVSMEAKINKFGGLELDYELDLDFEEIESLQMPDISHGRYLHDFKVNKTAIIDPDGQRCFVMPLNREEISPPRSLMEIISRLKNGAYELDLDQIQHQTRVVLPPLDSLEGYGLFIKSSCDHYTTYFLEEVERQVVKRSAQDSSLPLNGFVEFAGNGFIRYEILNLHETER